MPRQARSKSLPPPRSHSPSPSSPSSPSILPSSPPSSPASLPSKQVLTSNSSLLLHPNSPVLALSLSPSTSEIVGSSVTVDKTTTTKTPRRDAPSPTDRSSLPLTHTDSLVLTHNALTSGPTSYPPTDFTDDLITDDFTDPLSSPSLNLLSLLASPHLSLLPLLLLLSSIDHVATVAFSAAAFSLPVAFLLAKSCAAPTVLPAAAISASLLELLLCFSGKSGSSHSLLLILLGLSLSACRVSFLTVVKCTVLDRSHRRSSSRGDSFSSYSTESFPSNLGASSSTASIGALIFVCFSTLFKACFGSAAPAAVLSAVAAVLLWGATSSYCSKSFDGATVRLISSPSFKPRRPYPLFNKTLLLLSCCALSLSFATSFVLPTAASIAIGAVSDNVEAAATVVASSLYFLSSSLASSRAGSLCSHVGCKPLLLASLALSAISLLLLSLATSLLAVPVAKVFAAPALFLVSLTLGALGSGTGEVAVVAMANERAEKVGLFELFVGAVDAGRLLGASFAAVAASACLSLEGRESDSAVFCSAALLAACALAIAACYFQRADAPLMLTEYVDSFGVVNGIVAAVATRENVEQRSPTLKLKKKMKRNGLGGGCELGGGLAGFSYEEMGAEL